jgi:uncharacterized protein (TIGR02231 family)
VNNYQTIQHFGKNMINKATSRKYPVLPLWLFLFIMAWATHAQARPVEVTVFPDKARVFEETITPIIRQDSRSYAELLLPAQADPDTINISIENGHGLSITDISRKEIIPVDDHQSARLKKELDELLRKKDSLDISLKSALAGASFWENQAGFQAGRLSEMEETSRAISSNLLQVYTHIHEIRQELEDVNKEIADLKRRIEQITGPENMIWKVTVYLEAPADKEKAEIAYNYILENSGWSSFYRLDARPGDEQIFFTWNVEVWQGSGTDWDDVQMSLATLEPQRQISPRPLPKWEVGPLKDFRPVTRMAEQGKDMVMMETRALSPEALPVVERTGTFSQWILGRRSLKAGDRPRFTILEEAWPANYTHLVRPAVTDRAFIRAEIEFEEARDLPGGEALFLLNGTLVGKRNLILAGTEETMFFGHDPYVSARLVTREKKSGTRGVFTSRQTYLWDFVVTLENNQQYPVQIRLEEPMPVIGDERINVSYDFSPEPDERTENLFIWKLDLEPGSDRDISLRINMDAPGDMDVDWGWRR